MRVLFFATRLIYGGGEKVRNWLASQLYENGHEVIYVTSRYDNSYINELKQVSLYGKVKVITYPYKLKKKNPIAFCKFVKNIYINNNVDLLIYFGGSLVEQLSAKYMGIKIIVSERCDPKSRDFMSRVLKRIQYTISDGYVFQTPEAAKYYGRRAQRLGVVIPNPIIDNLPDPILEDLRKEIVTVGRLSHEKNQTMLINAFSNFVKDNPNYKLIIYGKGQLESNIRSYIISKNLQDKVNLISDQYNIVNCIRGAELFVLPSNTEGMPNALIEAMSIGLLCISTDCPIYGPRMLIENGVNGFLTPVGDEEQLSELMKRLIKSSEDYNFVRQNALKIKSTLNPSVILKKWINYIDVIVN